MSISHIPTLGAVTLCLVASSCSLRNQSAQVSSKTPDTAGLVFVGDIMLADRPGKCIARGMDPFNEFAGILKASDASIGNLECVVSTKGKPMVGKSWTFQPNPRVLPMVARHFDVVSLANNHTGDFGNDAFLEQLDLLDQYHIAHIGGGRNAPEARTPHILTINGLRIALLAYNEIHPREFEAGPCRPGVAWGVDEQVIADVKAARSIHKADLVIPFMHWGDEHEPVSQRQRQFARQMIDAGADVIVGSHPHRTQGAEYYKGKLIVYSLSDFVFDGFKEGPPRYGWLLRLRLDRQGLTTWDTVVSHVDDDGIPHLEKLTASPAGDARKGTIGMKRALADSPVRSRVTPHFP